MPCLLNLGYTLFVLLRSSPIRNTSEIIWVFKKQLVKLSKLRNGEKTFQTFDLMVFVSLWNYFFNKNKKTKKHDYFQAPWIRKITLTCWYCQVPTLITVNIRCSDLDFLDCTVLLIEFFWKNSNYFSFCVMIFFRSYFTLNWYF